MDALHGLEYRWPQPKMRNQKCGFGHDRNRQYSGGGTALPKDTHAVILAPKNSIDNSICTPLEAKSQNIPLTNATPVTQFPIPPPRLKSPDQPRSCLQNVIDLSSSEVHLYDQISVGPKHQQELT